MVGREHKRTNNRTMFPALKNNVAAGYQGPAKKELLKGVSLLDIDGDIVYNSCNRGLNWKKNIIIR